MDQVFLCLKRNIMCEEGKCVMALVYSSTNSPCEKGCFYRTKNDDRENKETEDKKEKMETMKDKRKQ
jgi:hypothetical protein